MTAPSRGFQYIGFLRAINVGGHVVTMSELRKILESLGLQSVETFIASGNVIFKTSSRSTAALEKRIENALRSNLGYDVSTFLRTRDEIRAVAEAAPFAPSIAAAAAAFNVAFTNVAITAEQKKQLSGFASAIDEFAAIEREIYWLCKVKQSESRFVSAKLERALGLRVTWRNLNTVRRLSDKYPP